MRSIGSPWSMQEPRGVAAALLAQVRDAAGDLERSEQLAREDIRLAEQAQSEISDCAAAINQAQSSAGMGICPEIGNAQAQLMQAEQLLRSQKYEQSIQYAGAATQLARQLYYAAMQQAMMRADAAAWPNNGGGLRGGRPRRGTESASGPPRPPRPRPRFSRMPQLPHRPEPAPEPEPATAGGSWGGETAQGNW